VRLEAAFNVLVFNFSHLVLTRTHTSREYSSGMANTNIDIDQLGHVGFNFFVNYLRSAVRRGVAFVRISEEKVDATRSPGQPILI